jgi:hypothetical protein
MSKHGFEMECVATELFYCHFNNFKYLGVEPVFSCVNLKLLMCVQFLYVEPRVTEHVIRMAATLKAGIKCKLLLIQGKWML